LILVHPLLLLLVLLVLLLHEPRSQTRTNNQIQSGALFAWTETLDGWATRDF
jgi:hypothetical protein